jgi:hypothetical protein
MGRERSRGRRLGGGSGGIGSRDRFGRMGSCWMLGLEWSFGLWMLCGLNVSCGEERGREGMYVV